MGPAVTRPCDQSGAGASPAPATGLVDRAATAFTAYLDGDRQQMVVLVDVLTPLLWHTARGQGLPKPIAEDVVQTAWLRLVDHATRIEAPRTVTAWLLTTVKRESWRVARSRRRDDAPLEEEPELIATDPGPERLALLREQHRALWRHVARLTPRCQHLLRVIAFADRPDYDTIAQTLGMPVGSIGPTRGRCLASLRSFLEADPSWDGGLR